MFRRSSLWRWRPIRLQSIPASALVVEPDPDARPTTGPVSNFINTQSDQFGWQTVVVVQPRFFYAGKAREPYRGEYRVSFAVKRENGEVFAMVCKKWLKGPVGLLIGPRETHFFITPIVRQAPPEIKLCLVQRTTRQGLNPAIPLI